MAFALYDDAVFPWKNVSVVQFLLSGIAFINLSYWTMRFGAAFKLFSLSVVSSWIVLTVLAIVFSAHSFVLGRFRTMVPLKFLRATARLTATVLFLPFNQILVSTFVCDEGAQWSNTSVSCSSGGFKMIQSLSGLLMPTFALFALVVSAVFFERSDPWRPLGSSGAVGIAAEYRSAAAGDGAATGLAVGSNNGATGLSTRVGASATAAAAAGSQGPARVDASAVRSGAAAALAAEKRRLLLVSRSHGRSSFAVVAVKLMLAVVFAFAAKVNAWLLHAAVIGAGVVVLWTHAWYLPYEVQAMNRLWSAFAAVFLWASVTGLLARVWNGATPDVAAEAAAGAAAPVAAAATDALAAGYVLCFGLPIAAFAGYALARMRFERFLRPISVANTHGLGGQGASDAGDWAGDRAGAGSSSGPGGATGGHTGGHINSPWDVELRARAIMQSYLEVLEKVARNKGQKSAQALARAQAVAASAGSAGRRRRESTLGPRKELDLRLQGENGLALLQGTQAITRSRSLPPVASTGTAAGGRGREGAQTGVGKKSAPSYKKNEVVPLVSNQGRGTSTRVAATPSERGRSRSRAAEQPDASASKRGRETQSQPAPVGRTPRHSSVHFGDKLGSSLHTRVGADDAALLAPADARLMPTGAAHTAVAVMGESRAPDESPLGGLLHADGLDMVDVDGLPADPVELRNHFVAKAMTLYEEAMLKLPPSAVLCFFYASFLRIHVGDPELEQVLVEYGLSLDALLDVRFLLFQLLREIQTAAQKDINAFKQDEAMSKLQQKNRDMHFVDQIQYNHHLVSCAEQSTVARRLEADFWGELLKQEPSGVRLRLLRHRINKAVLAATRSFDRLLEMHPDAISVLQAYALFMQEVRHDPAAAEALFDRCERLMRLEERQRERKANAMGLGLGDTVGALAPVLADVTTAEQSATLSVPPVPLPFSSVTASDESASVADDGASPRRPDGGKSGKWSSLRGKIKSVSAFSGMLSSVHQQAAKASIAANERTTGTSTNGAADSAEAGTGSMLSMSARPLPFPETATAVDPMGLGGASRNGSSLLLQPPAQHAASARSLHRTSSIRTSRNTHLISSLASRRLAAAEKVDGSAKVEEESMTQYATGVDAKSKHKLNAVFNYAAEAMSMRREGSLIFGEGSSTSFRKGSSMNFGNGGSTSFREGSSMNFRNGGSTSFREGGSMSFRNNGNGESSGSSHKARASNLRKAALGSASGVGSFLRGSAEYKSGHGTSDPGGRGSFASIRNSVRADALGGQDWTGSMHEYEYVIDDDDDDESENRGLLASNSPRQDEPASADAGESEASEGSSNGGSSAYGADRLGHLGFLVDVVEDRKETDSFRPLKILLLLLLLGVCLFDGLWFSIQLNKLSTIEVISTVSEDLSSLEHTVHMIAQEQIQLSMKAAQLTSPSIALSSPLDLNITVWQLMQSQAAAVESVGGYQASVFSFLSSHDATRAIASTFSQPRLCFPTRGLNALASLDLSGQRIDCIGKPAGSMGAQAMSINEVLDGVVRIARALYPGMLRADFSSADVHQLVMMGHGLARPALANLQEMVYESIMALFRKDAQHAWIALIISLVLVGCFPFIVVYPFILRTIMLEDAVFDCCQAAPVNVIQKLHAGFLMQLQLLKSHATSEEEELETAIADLSETDVPEAEGAKNKQKEKGKTRCRNCKCLWRLQSSECATRVHRWQRAARLTARLTWIWFAIAVLLAGSCLFTLQNSAAAKALIRQSLLVGRIRADVHTIDASMSRLLVAPVAAAADAGVFLRAGAAPSASPSPNPMATFPTGISRGHWETGLFWNNYQDALVQLAESEDALAKDVRDLQDVVYTAMFENACLSLIATSSKSPAICKSAAAKNSLGTSASSTGQLHTGIQAELLEMTSDVSRVISGKLPDVSSFIDRKENITVLELKPVVFYFENTLALTGAVQGISILMGDVQASLGNAMESIFTTRLVVATVFAVIAFILALILYCAAVDPLIRDYATDLKVTRSTLLFLPERYR
jgi:hypothetical protein